MSAKSNGRSSPASTDRDKPDKPDKPLVAPEKLTDAITQAADVALVLAGQYAGVVVAKARGQVRDPQRWTPTSGERALILRPTSSIVARHIRGDVATADAIDAAMIAAGTAHFVVRAAFDLDLLPETHDKGTP